MSERGQIRHSSERRGGYLASALAFAGITALWAWIVRDDPYYAVTRLLGFELPAATVFYLTAMPLAGFLLGRWRYHVDERAGGGWPARAAARATHFLYTHLLIVLFTFAMMTDFFLGWNIDDSVRRLDDRLFDLGSRFAPWLSAYLAGFNLGRASAA